MHLLSVLGSSLNSRSMGNYVSYEISTIHTYVSIFVEYLFLRINYKIKKQLEKKKRKHYAQNYKFKRKVKMDGRQWDSNPQEEKYVFLEIQPCCSQGHFSDIFKGIQNILISFYASKYRSNHCSPVTVYKQSKCQ